MKDIPTCTIIVDIVVYLVYLYEIVHLYYWAMTLLKIFARRMKSLIYKRLCINEFISHFK